MFGFVNRGAEGLPSMDPNRSSRDDSSMSNVYGKTGPSGGDIEREQRRHEQLHATVRRLGLSIKYDCPKCNPDRYVGDDYPGRTGGSIPR